MKRLLTSSLGIAVWVVALLAVPSVVRAESFSYYFLTPDFLIPVKGQNGQLTVYSDGSPATTGCVPGPVSTSCFNALGSQSFELGAYSSTTGNLTLNLYFTGSPLGDPNYEFNSAYIRFTVRDFDFLTDYITQSVTLKEMAIINAVNGEVLTPGGTGPDPISLKNYLPSGTTVTDDRTITLQPIDLMPLLALNDFQDPFILSIGLQATVWNKSGSKVKLVNTPESLFAKVRMDVDVREVPEPATALLLGLGFLATGRRRRLARS